MISTKSEGKLITLYEKLHDSIHAKSGQSELLKLQYIRTDTESVMGWITQPFELYVAVSPRLPKSAVIGAANAVVRVHHLLAAVDAYVMLFTSPGSGFRITLAVPKLMRSYVNKTALRPIPKPRVFPAIPDNPKSTPLHVLSVRQFLTAIGRSSRQKLKPESWEAFWKTSGHEMKKAGLAVKDRRYILWCMEKYRLGADPREFAHEAKPKKTIRG
ncbi:hypothetical protein NP233_g7201 [Leucocoprinus birnbaumii]|uniref:Small ribosomal subunit protein mS41 n=1 Tax=Leucocoprinus birnbaumii TaxID=56174 RepID=A0AAD5YUZ2_9AGAR|nr:hypothetical protein NP233_g7201 [Leucocoprinus birnbaumii]